jgi:hypothetical protein
VLENRNDVILCHTQVNVIDEAGEVIRHDPIDAYPLDSDMASERFNALIRTDLDNYEVFGVIRNEVLEKTPLIPGYIASDRVLRAELGLRGKFHILPEPLFFCRDHPMRSIRAMPAHHKRGQWFDPKLKSRFIFPHWRIFAEYFKCIGRVEELSSHEKSISRLAALKWLGVHQNWARLLADPLLVLFPGMEDLLTRCSKHMDANGEAH